MGLVRAFRGSIGGALSDQWKDFYTIPSGVSPTAALFAAVPKGTVSGRGANTKSSAREGVITNGSKIVVPEGYGLLLLQDGKLTSFVGESGGFIWQSNNIESESLFVGDSLSSSVIKKSWERFKFGGRTTGEQLALFVCLKELPNNRFGTQSPIYWHDGYINAQVGAETRGSYSIRIVDPILFAANYVSAPYLAGRSIFDFTDLANPASGQLFSEVVASLAAAFSAYTNDPNRQSSISQIQGNVSNVARALNGVLEQNYRWETSRGLEITNVSLVAVEYDAMSLQLLKSVQRADALSGMRGNSNLQASLAQGLQSAGTTSGAGGMIGVAMAGGNLGLANYHQPQDKPDIAEEAEKGSGGVGLISKLTELKSAFEAGLITEAEYTAAKNQLLGLSS